MTPIDYWWVQPTVVAIGIVTSLVLATATILNNRRIARLKATIDLIESAESEVYYQQLYHNFRKYKKDSSFRDRVLSPQNDDDWEARYACLGYLNHFELVAISCKKGLIDEKFYRDWMEYVVVRDWRAGEHLISAARQPKNPGDPGDALAYCNLEALCLKWEKKRLKRNR